VPPGRTQGLRHLRRLDLGLGNPFLVVQHCRLLYRVVLALTIACAAAFQAPVSAVGSSRVAVRSPAVVAMADEVEDKVKGIIAEQLGVELDTVVRARPSPRTWAPTRSTPSS